MQKPMGWGWVLGHGKDCSSDTENVMKEQPGKEEKLPYGPIKCA